MQFISVSHSSRYLTVFPVSFAYSISARVLPQSVKQWDGSFRFTV